MALDNFFFLEKIIVFFNNFDCGIKKASERKGGAKSFAGAN